MQSINDVTFEQALDYYGKSVGAVLIADRAADTYRALVRRGIFQDVIAESGTYEELVRTLWFHYSADGREITDTYSVFVPNMSKFAGKYSKRLKLILGEIPHLVQMSVQPVGEDERYLFLLDELDESVKEKDEETENKVSTIQNNIYVFTMAFDLVRLMIENGADKESFDTILTSGANSSLPHAIPMAKKLEQPILIDWGAIFEGYCSDNTRTIVYTEYQHEIWDIVAESHDKAIKAIKPGMKC